MCGAGWTTPAAGQQAPKRVISIVPSVTEILFAVGAGPQVVAVGSFDTFPAEVKALPRVGALIDPDLEQILSLKPDLVIVYGTQTELERQLSRAGIKTVGYVHGGVQDTLQSVRDIGRLTGHAAEGMRLAADIQAKLEAIRSRVKGRARPRTLLVFGREPKTLQQIYVAGGRGFMSDMIDIAGGTNAFADVRSESMQPSHETLLVRAPEVIVEIRATPLLGGGDADESARTWSTLPAIPAVRNRRIHVLAGEYLVVPGPRIAMATEALARVLHPEAF